MADDLNERVARVETRLDSHEDECGRRYASLEKGIDASNATGNAIHSRISNLRQDFARIMVGLAGSVILLLLAIIGFLFARTMGWK